MNSVKAEPLPPELHVIYPFGRPLILERSKEGRWSVYKQPPPPETTEGILTKEDGKVAVDQHFPPEKK